MEQMLQNMPFTCCGVGALPAPKDVAHGILMYAQLSITHQILDVPAAWMASS